MIKLRTKTKRTGWRAEGKLKQDKAIAFNQVDEKVRGSGIVKYLCKRGKGEHDYFLKKLKRYERCSGLFNGFLCESFTQKGQCPEGLKRIDDWISEEWRCRACNKKDMRSRYEKP